MMWTRGRSGVLGGGCGLASRCRQRRLARVVSSWLAGPACLTLVARPHRMTPRITVRNLRHATTAQDGHSGLAHGTRLSQHSALRERGRVLRRRNRTLPAMARPYGWRRIVTTVLVDRWPAPSGESGARDDSDAGSFWGLRRRTRSSQPLQATPVDASLVAWSRGSGVPELGRSATNYAPTPIL